MLCGFFANLTLQIRLLLKIGLVDASEQPPY